MSEQQFSFRWGIPWLDQGFTQIPSFFFRRYAQAGVTCEEFAFILHLANYKYESPRGQSSPSLETIAAQMGYSIRQVRRLRAQLETKALLTVNFRPGDTSIYSFENFARRMLQLEEAATPDVTPDTHVLPTPDTSDRVPRTPTSAEEQEQHKKTTTTVGVVVASQNAQDQEGKNLLVAEGVRPKIAAELSSHHSTQRIKDVIQCAHDTPSIHNKPAWIVEALDKGYILVPSAAQQHNTDLLQNLIRNCAWHRNPSMRPCPTVVDQRPLLPACAKCDLQPQM